jgi:hypothetical protein
MRGSFIPLAVLGTLPLFWIPPSQAQDFCSNLNQIVALAPSGFGSILGKANSRGTGNDVTRKLPGADNCWFMSRRSSYWCSWNVDRSKLKSELIKLTNAVSKCYPTFELDPSFNDPEPSAWVTSKTIEIYIAADNDDSTIQISINPR